ERAKSRKRVHASELRSCSTCSAMEACRASASARRCSGVLVFLILRAIVLPPVTVFVLFRAVCLTPPPRFCREGTKCHSGREDGVQPVGRRGREVRREIRERSDRVPKFAAEPAAQPLARTTTPVACHRPHGERPAPPAQPQPAAPQA